MNISFVSASEFDRNYLIELRRKTMIPHLIKAGVHLSEEEHLNRVNANYSCFKMILVNNMRKGAVKYLMLEGKLEILQLQIEPKYQGQGIGRATLKKLKQLANGRTIRLSVLKDNPAYYLYLRLGFRVIGQDSYEFLMEFR